MMTNITSMMISLNTNTLTVHNTQCINFVARRQLRDTKKGPWSKCKRVSYLPSIHSFSRWATVCKHHTHTKIAKHFFFFKNCDLIAKIFVRISSSFEVEWTRRAIYLIQYQLTFSLQRDNSCPVLYWIASENCLLLSSKTTIHSQKVERRQFYSNLRCG